ncbi:hypothetical protein KY317_03110 [Candidatus Woesearchaeota archaeon]|nr:hypothetical protein [Candidatus Woesearchaeota archaeon]
MAKAKKQFSSVHSVYIGITIAVLCLALVIIFKPETTTGSAVYVKYHGVSDQPLAEEAGKIQTYVKLSEETISDLEHDSNQADVGIAENKIETADFSNGLVELYKINPAVPGKIGNLNEIAKGGESLANDFKANVECINRIGKSFIGAKEAEFVVVTELLYSECSSQYKLGETWLGAMAGHKFYTIDGEFICKYNSYPLFTINKNTGELSSNIGEC